MRLQGRLQIETVGSSALRGNPLGDPRVRDIPVYLPPGYGERGRRFPALYFLPGFTSDARKVANASPWQESLIQRLDRLIAAGAAKPCLLVVADGFTRYGGSQYVNSAATGRYEDFVARELVGFVDDKFATRAEPSARAIFGKSSGGFGALWIGSRHPAVFGHVASHSGDMGFELSYGRDIPGCVNRLERYGGRFAGFLREFDRTPPRLRGEFPHELVNMAGMASCYSPNPRSPLGFDLPFDERTGELRPAVWRRWRAFDPVVWAARRAPALRRLKTLFFDCGRRDEFFLHLGARVLSRELTRLRVRHRYEEHGFGHMDMAERYDVSLALLSKAASR